MTAVTAPEQPQVPRTDSDSCTRVRRCGVGGAGWLSLAQKTKQRLNMHEALDFNTCASSLDMCHLLANIRRNGYLLC